MRLIRNLVLLGLTCLMAVGSCRAEELTYLRIGDSEWHDRDGLPYRFEKYGIVLHETEGFRRLDLFNAVVPRVEARGDLAIQVKGESAVGGQGDYAINIAGRLHLFGSGGLSVIASPTAYRLIWASEITIAGLSLSLEASQCRASSTGIYAYDGGVMISGASVAMAGGEGEFLYAEGNVDILASAVTCVADYGIESRGERMVIDGSILNMVVKSYGLTLLRSIGQLLIQHSYVNIAATGGYSISIYRGGSYDRFAWFDHSVIRLYAGADGPCVRGQNLEIGEGDYVFVRKGLTYESESWNNAAIMAEAVTLKGGNVRVCAPNRMAIAAWNGISVLSGRFELVPSVDLRTDLAFDAAAAAICGTAILAFDASSLVANGFVHALSNAYAAGRLEMSVRGRPLYGLLAYGSYVQSGGTVWCDAADYGITVYFSEFFGHDDLWPVVNGGSAKGRFFRESSSLHDLQRPIREVSPKQTAENGLSANLVPKVIQVSGTRKYDKVTDASALRVPGYYGTQSLYVDGNSELHLWVPEGWTPRYYTIRFIKNDGAGTLTERAFPYGQSTALPSLAKLGWTRRGLDFLGWATSTANVAAGKVWKTDGARVVSPTAVDTKIDAIAMWALKPGYYQIKYQKNDGSGKWRSAAYEYGANTVLASCEAGLGWTRPGYTFKGWSLTPDGAIWKGDRGVVATGIPAGTMRNIYAIWEKNVPTYTIRFIKNDGAGTFTNVVFKHGVKTALPTLAKLGWARRGQDFLGWAATTADAAAGKVWMTDGASVTYPTGAGTSIDAIASWSLKPGYYQIKYQKNDGSGKWRSAAYEYGVKSVLSSCAAGLGWSRPGYTFKGWSLTPNGTIWKGDCGVVATGIPAGTTRNIYAIWESDLGGVQLWEGGPYWAECNVGAEKPEDDGYYFWWGDTVGHTRGDKSFSFSEGNCPVYGKSSAQLQSAGYADARGVLTPKHDAATVHWGGSWRMPTSAEMQALVKNCTSTWTTRNGVYGRLLTGKGAYASRSIFLPAAGYGAALNIIRRGVGGYYWTSTLYSYDPYFALELDFDSSGISANFAALLYDGQPVRPVRSPDK